MMTQWGRVRGSGSQMSVAWHQMVDCLRWLGLRDRLRCPYCAAVGTYKPHGGWLDRDDTRGVRRWVCKWCGYYRDAEGEQIAVLGRGVWEFKKDWPQGTTPRAMVGRVNPWAG